MRDFSEVFCQLRKERNISQKVIADFLGVSDRTVRFYQTGGHRPDFEGLLKLADFFDVSIDYLVGRTDKREVNR